MAVPKPYWWDKLAALIAADPDWYAKYVVAEAERGNPFPLIGRLSNVTQLSNAEIMSIVAALRATASKETNTYLRRLEKELIAIEVDRMIDDDKAPLKQKQAIAKVIQGRGRSTSHIKDAITAHGKKRYHTR